VDTRDAGDDAGSDPTPQTDGGGTLNGTLPEWMIWKLTLMPEGSTDPDDADVEYYSFVSTAPGTYAVRSCLSELEPVGQGLSYTVDCTGPDEISGTATATSLSLDATVDLEPGDFVLTMQVDPSLLTLDGTFDTPDFAGTLFGQRVD
jgi:hypothetical protein